MDFKLLLEPADTLHFQGKKLGEEAVSLTLKVTNPLKERVVVKIKCTSNELFRIRPPVLAIKEGESSNVVLSFCSGRPIPPDNEKHYFAVYYSPTKEEKKTARQIWTDLGKTEVPSKKVYAVFSKEDGDAKNEKKEEKDEKKEEKKTEKKEEKEEDKEKDKEKEEKK